MPSSSAGREERPLSFSTAPPAGANSTRVRATRWPRTRAVPRPGVPGGVIDPLSSGAHRRMIVLTMERSFSRDFSALDAIFGFVAGFLDHHGLEPEQSFEIDLIVEELFTNMVKYGVGRRGEIALDLRREGDDLLITLVDSDVDEFDITAVPAPEMNLPLRQLRPGGLGLHLVRQYADQIHYEYRDRNSIITVTKRLIT
jgi:serine/threonine-protein kinase RsbW